MQQRRPVSGAAAHLMLLLCVHLIQSPVANATAVGYFHQLDAAHCPGTKLLKVVLRPANERLALLLHESSRDFLSSDTVVDGQFFNLRYRPCFYQGGNEDVPEDTTAVAKLAGGLLSGTFIHNGVTYEMLKQPADSAEFEARRMVSAERKFSCGVDATKANGHSHGEHSRMRREILPSMDLHSHVAPVDQTYVALVLIGDQAFVNGTGGGVLTATERLWEIGNYINNLYKPIGVNVVTVRASTLFGDALGLGRNESGSNPTTMLRNFMLYRMRYITDIQHSAAHLVSGLRMTGANVGLAHTGKLCQFAQSGGVNSDTDMTGSAMNVAVTVTHELGHNLGMDHDPDPPGPCGCPDPQGCIMTAVGTSVNPVRFSNCSIQRYAQFNVKNGLAYCTSRPISRNNLAEKAPKCGNWVVEYGEECDCGLPGYCNNTCCNATTCKFTSGASCASGQCCNTTSCSPISKGTVCRAARGVCDLPEFCNGTSEWCPPLDDHKIDGTVCATNASNPTQAMARCYKAECATRDERCRGLFAESDVRAAPESESPLSQSGSMTGYCSYSPSTYDPIVYSYTGCTPANRRCGTLYCSATMPGGFATKRWLGMDDMQGASTSPYTDGAGDLAYARIDMRLTGYRDPGMVPDGAECGAGLMCVSSQCRNVSSVMSTLAAAAGSGPVPDCNGNGVVTQAALCYCNYGFRPPDCVHPGYGGSLSNQPAETGNITTARPTTTTAGTPTTRTTDLVSTLFDQKRDDFWMYVGIGIAIGVVVILAAIFFVWLYFWCRRNDTRPYVGGLEVAVTDSSSAIAFRSCGDPKSYPVNVDTTEHETVSNGQHKTHVENYYDYSQPKEHIAPRSLMYRLELNDGTPGVFSQKA